MNRAHDWMSVQDFTAAVREAKRSALPFVAPNASNIFEARAARDAYEDALTKEACETVWPFLQQQQAAGNVWLRLGNGASEPATSSLLIVRCPDQPVGLGINLTVGTVGSSRWQVEGDDFSGPDDYHEENEMQHISRHGPFLGCPVVIDRTACETALYEIRHGRRASESDILEWARDMRAFGGRPTRDMIIHEYKRSFRHSTDESADTFWKSVRSNAGLPANGTRPTNIERQKTEEFLAVKPHP